MQTILDDTLEVRREGFDSVSSEVNELLEQWDNRLGFPFSGLGERYLRGDLSPVVTIYWNQGGTGKDSRGSLMRVLYGHALKPLLGLKADTDSMHDNDECSVLVDSVQIVDEPKRVTRSVGSRIWLQFPNALQCRLTRNSLYFSLVFMRFVFLRIVSGIIEEDREFYPSREISPIFNGRELPCNMIERRSKLVHDFACDNAPLRIKAAIENHIFQFLKCLPVLIGPDWIFADKINRGQTVDKCVDFPFQVEDVLVGPF